MLVDIDNEKMLPTLEKMIMPMITVMAMMTAIKDNSDDDSNNHNDAYDVDKGREEEKEQRGV